MDERLTGHTSNTFWETLCNTKNIINYYSALLNTACLTWGFRNSVMSGKCVKSAPSSSFTDIQDRFFSATTCALNSAGGLSNIYGQKDDLNNFVLSGTRRGNVFLSRAWTADSSLDVWFRKNIKKWVYWFKSSSATAFSRTLGYHVHIRHQEGLDHLQSSVKRIIMKTSHARLTNETGHRLLSAEEAACLTGKGLDWSHRGARFLVSRNT